MTHPLRTWIGLKELLGLTQYSLNSSAGNIRFLPACYVCVRGEVNSEMYTTYHPLRRNGELGGGGYTLAHAEDVPALALCTPRQSLSLRLYPSSPSCTGVILNRSRHQMWLLHLQTYVRHSCCPKVRTWVILLYCFIKPPTDIFAWV